MGRCRDFVKRQYGFDCDTTERAVVLNAAAPVLVLNNDPNRVAWTIFNLGANIGYLAFTSAVGALYGFQINAAGDYTSSSARDDGEMPTHEVYGLGVGATTLYVIEVIAVD